jgi:hypothetical protein
VGHEVVAQDEGVQVAGPVGEVVLRDGVNLWPISRISFAGKWIKEKIKCFRFVDVIEAVTFVQEFVFWQLSG